jgi:hypothetical protein
MSHVDAEGQQVHAELKMHMPHTAQAQDFITARHSASTCDILDTFLPPDFPSPSL